MKEQTFKDRLIEEKNQLQGKTEKLSAFLNSEKILDIDKLQVELLQIQYSTMISYLSILRVRLTFLI